VLKVRPELVERKTELMKWRPASLRQKRIDRGKAGGFEALRERTEKLRWQKAKTAKRKEAVKKARRAKEKAGEMAQRGEIVLEKCLELLQKGPLHLIEVKRRLAE